MLDNVAEKYVENNFTELNSTLATEIKLNRYYFYNYQYLKLPFLKLNYGSKLLSIK
jgi:hypothetical protein